MKKIILEATDENVLQTIADDKLQRTNDLKSFINILENINYNAFISIDAPWGSGKSFFIRQAEMTLRYNNKKRFEQEITEEERTAFDFNVALRDLELNNTYFPVYFNAWLYDNHTDALLALVLVAIKQSQKYIETTLDGNWVDKVSSLMDGIQFWRCNNWKETWNSFKDKDILTEAKLLEDIKCLIYAIFDEIIAEKGQKLVIFVDELDRCKPSFAIEVLESIKHYIDDDRIIFVVSLNKSQLVYTIANYYGTGFDSSGYLNRFFDISLELPECNMDMYMKIMDFEQHTTLRLTKIANEIRDAYKLSMRDTAIYLSKIRDIDKNKSIYGRDTWVLLSLLVPSICILDMIQVEDKKKVLEGKGEEILQEILYNSESAKRTITNLVTIMEEGEDLLEKGWEEFLKIYKYAFLNDEGHVWYPGQFEIDNKFKNLCLQICNKR